MKKKIMTLMAGMLLLLTACGQTGNSSASTMLPVAAVQSAAQAVVPVEDKAQENTESLPAEETVEETQDADSEETPKLAEEVKTPSGKTEETPSAPTGEEQPDAPEKPTTVRRPATGTAALSSTQRSGRQHRQSSGSLSASTAAPTPTMTGATVRSTTAWIPAGIPHLNCGINQLEKAANRVHIEEREVQG